MRRRGNGKWAAGLAKRRRHLVGQRACNCEGGRMAQGSLKQEEGGPQARRQKAKNRASVPSPATIMTSDWRGDARKRMPERSMSYLAAAACIISTRIMQARRSSATSKTYVPSSPGGQTASSRTLRPAQLVMRQTCRCSARPFWKQPGRSCRAARGAGEITTLPAHPSAGSVPAVSTASASALTGGSAR